MSAYCMYELQHLWDFDMNWIEGLWPVFGLMTYMNIYHNAGLLCHQLWYMHTVALWKADWLMCTALLIYSSKLKA